MHRPLVGLTADIIIAPGARPKAGQALTYVDAITAAGGVPILLPPIAADAARHAALCAAFVFTGGDDIDMARRGGVTHREAKVMDPRRQDYEFALLQALQHDRPQAPVLGICLGMQMMAVHAGGELHQHLPDVYERAHEHRGDNVHAITAEHAGPRSALRSGRVTSNHHQGVARPGALQVLARSEDGVIEAASDPARAFYLGVQWHPERTENAELGAKIFEALIAAARQA